MVDLKPCPFCGDVPTIHENKWDLECISYSVCCDGDHHTATVGWFDSEEEAIEEWNRRIEYVF